MEIKGIVFDYDYTLGDSTKGIVICANDALKRLGWEPFSTEQIQKTIGLSLRETYRVLTGDPDPQRAKDYHLFFRERAQEVMAPNASFFPGIPQMLQHLFLGGWKLGIVTSKQSAQIDKILRLHHLRDYFETVIGSDDVSAEKPDPEGLLQIASTWKMEREELLYIGDSLVDAKTAEQAQIRFAAVTTGVTSAKDFEPFPHCAIFHGLQELIPFVEALPSH
ncbi:MAG: HAD-IA family hydrolase [Provencibacterium sp.]|jgi:phosphoglycolate phosphatase|nr:HAD-IA family hydrolase [Provencibacterium sp.]